jgi:hypothetical protein
MVRKTISKSKQFGLKIKSFEKPNYHHKKPRHGQVMAGLFSGKKHTKFSANPRRF